MKENYREIMSESGLPLDEERVKAEFQKLTAEENLITNTSKYSPFWRLITAIAVKPVLWLINALIETVLPNIFVKTANETFLQIMGWSIGLEFKEATKAQGTVTFYKSSPTNSITIKKDTVIQTERINGVIYRVFVTEDTLIPSGMTQKAVPVIAEQAGTAYNLGGGYYCILPESISGIERVSNADDWLTEVGANRESADEFRERYRTQFSSVGQHHIDSVYKGMIAQIAGLAIDRIYFLHDAPRGAGTANAYLLLDTGVASQPFIDKVNHHIIEQGFHGHGDDLICYAMPETKHDLTAKVFFYPEYGLSDSRKAEVLKKVELMIRCAFRENADFAVSKTYPYKRFSWSNLAKEIHAENVEVSSIEWGQADIVNALAVPRIRSLRVIQGA